MLQLHCPNEFYAGLVTGLFLALVACLVLALLWAGSD